MPRILSFFCTSLQILQLLPLAQFALQLRLIRNYNDSNYFKNVNKRVIFTQVRGVFLCVWQVVCLCWSVSGHPCLVNHKLSPYAIILELKHSSGLALVQASSLRYGGTLRETTAWPRIP